MALDITNLGEYMRALGQVIKDKAGIGADTVIYPADFDAHIGTVYEKGKLDQAALTNGGNAQASQILSGCSAYVKNRLVNGGMPANGAQTAAKSLSLSGGVLYSRIALGAYLTKAGSGWPEITVKQADLASAIGLSAAKLVKGATVLGLTGQNLVYQYKSVTQNASGNMSVGGQSYARLDISNLGFTPQSVTVRDNSDNTICLCTFGDNIMINPGYWNRIISKSQLSFSATSLVLPCPAAGSFTAFIWGTK